VRGRSPRAARGRVFYAPSLRPVKSCAVGTVADCREETVSVGTAPLAVRYGPQRQQQDIPRGRGVALAPTPRRICNSFIPQHDPASLSAIAPPSTRGMILVTMVGWHLLQPGRGRWSDDRPDSRPKSEWHQQHQDKRLSYGKSEDSGPRARFVSVVSALRRGIAVHRSSIADRNSRSCGPLALVISPTSHRPP